MSTATKTYDLPCYVGGEPVTSEDRLEVKYPYTGETIGTVPMLGSDHLELVVASGRFQSR